MAKESKPQTPLAYEPPSRAPGVSRGQFRVLLLLLLLHLVVVVQSTYLPGVSEQLRQAWAEHKAKAVEQAARDAAVRQQLALEQQCATFARPAGAVVWEESPEAAEKLLAGSGYRAASATVANLTDAGVLPRMAFAGDPPALAQLLPNHNSVPVDSQGGFRSGPLFSPSMPGPQFSTDQCPVVFLRRLTAPGGVARLAVISFEVGVAAAEFSGTSEDEWEKGKLRLCRAFAAATTTLPGGQSPPEELSCRRVLELDPEQEPADRSLKYVPPPGPGQPGRYELKGTDVLRVFAGQADPADAAHFTIAYELDGHPGTIDGRLMDDDTIHLVPREGRVVGTRWYPHAK